MDLSRDRGNSLSIPLLRGNQSLKTSDDLQGVQQGVAVGLNPRLPSAAVTRLEH